MVDRRLLLVCVVLCSGSLAFSQDLLFRKDGPKGRGWMGWSVCGTGDVNGDGVSDFAAGLPGELCADVRKTESNDVCVFSGVDGTILLTLIGPSTAEHFGQSVAGPGDVDLDGYHDILVGSFSTFLNGECYGSRGRASLYSGRTGQQIWDIEGVGAEASFGTSVSGLGDVNADGYPDVLVGARGDSRAGVDAGSVTVVSGRDGTPLITVLGQFAGDHFGHAVSAAGDVNQDGTVDFMVGAPNSDVAHYDGGQVSIYSGQTGALLFSLVGHGPQDFFGFSVGFHGGHQSRWSPRRNRGILWRRPYRNRLPDRAGGCLLRPESPGALLRLWPGRES